jgi:hypothetical protein
MLLYNTQRIDCKGFQKVSKTVLHNHVGKIRAQGQRNIYRCVEGVFSYDGIMSLQYINIIFPPNLRCALTDDERLTFRAVPVLCLWRGI